MLPTEVARRLGRRAGAAHPGPGVRFKSGRPQPLISKRLRWIAAVERCTSLSQLALQLRQLEGTIDWEALKRPSSDAVAPEWANASIQERRGEEFKAALEGYEYLVTRPSMHPLMGVIMASEWGAPGDGDGV